ncbi:MAG: AAA family ATPase [Burkholderiales bacterium]|nr:AAA family ATPase [Opitutaceae bacterium]
MSDTPTPHTLPPAAEERPLKLTRPPFATGPGPTIKPFTEAIRAALDTYRTEHGLSLTQLGRELGINSSHVSKYLAGKPEGDVPRLESTIEDVLKNAATRRREKKALFETPASRSIHSACELIRKTNDVGLVHGPAGLGKTSGVALYAGENPSAIVLTLSKWSGQADGIQAAVFAALESRGKTPGMRRAEWLVERLRGSNRLLVIDNAHRLTHGALQWLFDFQDATECPIALVGNPEVLAKIRENDQQFSRIGLLRAIKPTEVATLAKQMLQRLCPDHAPVLQDLATKVAGERGHLRALKKHLLLMPEFFTAAQSDPRKAFLMAHTQVVSDYQLED